MTEQTSPAFDLPQQSPYVGFWPRLAALFIDIIISSPLSAVLYFVNTMGRSMTVVSLFATSLFLLWYQVYLPKRYGGTPGKLLMKLRIIKTDGHDIELREAALRYGVHFMLGIGSTILSTYTILGNRNAGIYTSNYLMYSYVYMGILYLWYIVDAFTIFTNPQKRAIHDYIAGTVVIKKSTVIQFDTAPESSAPITL